MHYKAFSMQSDTSYHLSVESALNRFKIASTRVIYYKSYSSIHRWKYIVSALYAVSPRHTNESWAWGCTAPFYDY